MISVWLGKRNKTQHKPYRYVSAVQFFLTLSKCAKCCACKFGEFFYRLESTPAKAWALNFSHITNKPEITNEREKNIAKRH